MGHDPEGARIEALLDHHEHPRHHGRIEDAEVTMPGGNPGCGDVIVIHLKAKDVRSFDVSFEGEGCTVSQAACSLLLESVCGQGLSMDDVLQLDVDAMAQLVGEELLQARPRCATLGLATLKGAVLAWKRRHALEEATATS